MPRGRARRRGARRRAHGAARPRRGGAIMHWRPQRLQLARAERARAAYSVHVHAAPRATPLLTRALRTRARRRHQRHHGRGGGVPRRERGRCVSPQRAAARASRRRQFPARALSALPRVGPQSWWAASPARRAWSARRCAAADAAAPRAPPARASLARGHMWRRGARLRRRRAAAASRCRARAASSRRCAHTRRHAPVASR